MRKAIWKPRPKAPQEFCLKQICFEAIRKHLALANLDTKDILDLPTSLIMGVIPLLTACQLDDLQPMLNQKGISTRSGWLRILHDVYGPDESIVLFTEEEAKREAMRILFTSKFYGFEEFYKRNIPDLNAPSLLCAAAKSMKLFSLLPKSHKPLQSLVAEERPLLSLLEEHIQSVGISQSMDWKSTKSQIALFVLHRLLDHGRAEDVAVHVQCPMALAWVLHKRGSQYVDPDLHDLMHSYNANNLSQTVSTGGDGASFSSDTRCPEDQEVIPCKRLKLEEGARPTLDPRLLCQMFAPCKDPSTDSCPWGQIQCLKITRCEADSFRLLNAALPTFFCLRSLTLHNYSTFRDDDVRTLARALKQLSESSQSSLADLSVGILSHTNFVKVLLDASPKVTSLHVEVQAVMWGLPPPTHHFMTAETELSELPLEKLTVKLAEIETDQSIVMSVLRHCPHLTSLHVAGIRIPSRSSHCELLTTLSEANPRLKSLTLEDMKLSDCLPVILHLLSSCRLEELRLNDCRLLETWTEKDSSLRQLVAAVKAVPSLHTLSLAENRLAGTVHVLAELFSGPSPSSVQHLDISSNFIKAPELKAFAERLRTHPPKHRITLDVRINPGDRDPATWNAALRLLHPFCVVLVEEWNSTDTMVDHVSNM